MGFYIHYADEATPATVKSWNVRPIPLQRDNRHLDRCVATVQMYLFGVQSSDFHRQQEAAEAHCHATATRCGTSCSCIPDAY